MYQAKVAENIATHILCSLTFFLKILPFYEIEQTKIEQKVNVENCSIARQATDDILWYQKDVLCMPGN